MLLVIINLFRPTSYYNNIIVTFGLKIGFDCKTNVKSLGFIYRASSSIKCTSRGGSRGFLVRLYACTCEMVN